MTEGDRDDETKVEIMRQLHEALPRIYERIETSHRDLTDKLDKQAGTFHELDKSLLRTSNTASRAHERVDIVETAIEKHLEQHDKQREAARKWWWALGLGLIVMALPGLVDLIEKVSRLAK